MVCIDLFGKEDLIEKIAWCKKFADDEVKSSHIFGLDQKAHGIINEQLNDPNKIASHIKNLSLNFPTGEEFNALTQSIFKDIRFVVRFSKNEDIPGKVDYCFGFGAEIQTFPIFLEEAIYTQKEKKETRKKFGFLTETVTQKVRAIKDADELFENTKKESELRYSILGKEKDQKERLRFSLKIQLDCEGVKPIVPTKMDYKWVDDQDFLEKLTQFMTQTQDLINQVFRLVGYEKAPDYHLLFGAITDSRKMDKMVTKPLNNIEMISVNYV